eukprot:TRINITY_DN22841_c0_g1_i1.p1 TRINITY_DN22841_c0_g1~~TRINITY_DN22841_c0_g1_i1.p1  ORF type:complete len:721 (+),score=207.64 TRINITY_DN22841_c0_g1_i1:134-2296(+)
MPELTDDEDSSSSDGSDSVEQGASVPLRPQAVAAKARQVTSDDDSSDDSSAAAEKAAAQDSSSSSSSSSSEAAQKTVVATPPTRQPRCATDSDSSNSDDDGSSPSPAAAAANANGGSLSALSPSRKHVAEVVAKHERSAEELQKRKEEEEEELQRGRRARQAEHEARELEAEKQRELRRKKEEEEEAEREERRRRREEEERKEELDREERKKRREQEDREADEQRRRRQEEREALDSQKAEEAKRREQDLEEAKEKERLSALALEQQRQELERREQLRRQEEERLRREEWEAAERRRRAEDQAREARRTEAAIWSSLSPAEAHRLRAMLQGIQLFRQQIDQGHRGEEELHLQIASKEGACGQLRQRCEQADQEARLARQRESRQGEEIDRWDRKRIHCEEASEGLEILRTSHVAVQADIARLKEQVMPLQAELKILKQRLAASEDNGRANAARLASLKSQCQQEVADIKASQVAEYADTRAKQVEEQTKIEVSSTNEISELQALYAQEAASLRQNMEESHRQCERLRLERDESTDQLRARQREGARLQQQCSDAREEVFELSMQLRSSIHQGPATPQRQGLGRSFSASALDRSALNMSLQESQFVDAELWDLKQKCRDLEQHCARMHSALERGQVSFEKWRRRGVQVHRAEPDAAGGRPEPFALGPIEDASMEAHHAESDHVLRTPDANSRKVQDAPVPPNVLLAPPSPTKSVVSQPCST